MKKTKDTNPAPKEPVTDAPSDNLSPEEKIRSLEAENLRLQQIIVKGYGAATSVKNELKALREENESLHSQLIPENERLKSLAMKMVIVHSEVCCPFCFKTFKPKET